MCGGGGGGSDSHTLGVRVKRCGKWSRGMIRGARMEQEPGWALGQGSGVSTPAVTMRALRSSVITESSPRFTSASSERRVMTINTMVKRVIKPKKRSTRTSSPSVAECVPVTAAMIASSDGSSIGRAVLACNDPLQGASLSGFVQLPLSCP